jgi:hypothetical protein
LRKYGVRVGFKVMFLTIPRQGTTPEILKLKFPVPETETLSKIN